MLGVVISLICFLVSSRHFQRRVMMAYSIAPPTPMMNGVSMVCGENASANVNAVGSVRRATRNCQNVAKDCARNRIQGCAGEWRGGGGALMYCSFQNCTYSMCPCPVASSPKDCRSHQRQVRRLLDIIKMMILIYIPGI